MHSSTNCLHCGAPIIGRRDKRYCNNICKSRDFREQGGPRTTVIINASAPAPSRTSSQRLTAVDPPVAAPIPTAATQVIAAQPVVTVPPLRAKPLAEQVADSFAAVTAQREQRELDAAYVQLIEHFLDYEGQLHTRSQLHSLKIDAESLASSYREHPLVKQGDDLHRQRLKDLYVVRDATAEALAEAQEQPFWKEQRGGYQLPGKVRRKMRERLIG